MTNLVNSTSFGRKCELDDRLICRPQLKWLQIERRWSCKTVLINQILQISFACTHTWLSNLYFNIFWTFFRILKFPSLFAINIQLQFTCRKNCMLFYLSVQFYSNVTVITSSVGVSDTAPKRRVLGVVPLSSTFSLLRPGHCRSASIQDY